MFWDKFQALAEMVTCWYPPVEKQVQKSWNLFSSHLSSKGPLTSPEHRRGAVSTPHPVTDPLAPCKATSMNKCLQPSLFILLFNFAHLWWWEYLNIQTENTYDCLPVSTIFFMPASKTVNMGIKHLLCFQQEKRLQWGTTTNILYFWLRFFFNC